VGVRNHVIILPVDDLSNASAEAVAHNIKGTLAIPHPSAACLMMSSSGATALAGSSAPAAGSTAHNVNKIPNASATRHRSGNSG